MKCKSGDLAIIIKADLPEFIGMPVKVLNRGHDLQCRRHGLKQTWIVELPQRMKCWTGEMSNRIHHPDDFLQPIRGNSISKTEEKKDDLVIG